MTNSSITVAYITAGAGGMYCGSCMHDNTLARSLIKQGVDVQLIPLYTPIRTDEDDVSIDRVFFGGINVYLQQRIPLFRYLPRQLDRWLDARWLLRWATSRVAEMDPSELGALTVSMLRGSSGSQRKEVRRLVSWLGDSIQPDLIDFSNILIAGCTPRLKRELDVPVLVTLQGDDVFLEELAEPYKSQAFDEIRRLVEQIDGFIVNSQYYADFMADYFGIAPNKLHIVPLGIDTSDFRHFQQRLARPVEGHPATVGYLARLAPEKGLHVLVEAFLHLHRLGGMEQARLKIAGWLGEQNRSYVDEQLDRLRSAGLGDAVSYVGEVDRATKIEFLSEIDVLSVPSVYRDPKGLYVLEAAAAAVPAVQPTHGAFPELIGNLDGGVLVPPNDPEQLAVQLHRLLSDPVRCAEVGQRVRAAVHERFSMERMAGEVLRVYKSYLER